MHHLTGIDPRLPSVLLAFIVGGIVFWLRHKYTELFERLPKALQSLPALLLSTLGSALPMALGAVTLADGVRMIVEATSVAIAGHHIIGKHALPQPNRNEP